MRPLDWVIAAVISLSALAATSRGLVLELFSLAGLIAGVVVGGWKYTKAAEFLAGWGIPPTAAEAIAFLAIVFGVMLIASLLGTLLRTAARSLGLGAVDRLLGGLFGLVRGAVVVMVLVMALAAFYPGNRWAAGSKFAPYFIGASHRAALLVPPTLRMRIRDGCEEFRKHESKAGI